ncbi:MAG TPA: hypothetical protein VJC37_01000 [Planctomycetota bacterium]|nr:hypothetical protein [Planctomycetota bacterium]
MIKPFEVTTPKIATKAVTGEKIADNTIETRSFKTGSITPDKLTFSTATRPLSPGLETSEIKDAAITATKLAPNAVTTDHIAANAVATDDIKDNAITTEKIRDGAITRDKVADRSVNTADIVDGAVTNTKIAAGAVGASHLAVDSVESAKIKDGAITNAKIATNTITQGKIANNAIGTGEIQNGAVTPEKLSFVPGGAVRPLVPPVTTDELANGSVTTEKVAQTAISTEKLANSAVTTDKIANQAVTAEKLAPGVGGGDTLTMLPAPATALDLGGIVATTQPATVDLSTIIPLNTKGVIVSIACINQSYTDGGMMAYVYQQVGAEYALQVMAPAVNAPGISNGASVLMPVAADRTLLWQAYVAGNNSTELVIYILGYVV